MYLQSQKMYLQSQKMYLGSPVSWKYPLKVLFVFGFWFWLGLLFKKVFQFMKFLATGSLHKGNSGSCVFYDLGRKAWAKIKAQAGSDH